MLPVPDDPASLVWRAGWPPLARTQVSVRAESVGAGSRVMAVLSLGRRALFLASFGYGLWLLLLASALLRRDHSIALALFLVGLLGLALFAVGRYRARTDGDRLLEHVARALEAVPTPGGE